MLKAVVIVLGALIVIALGIMVAGLVFKFSGRGTSGTAATGTRFALPPGAKIVEMQTQPSRLILHVRTEAGEEVDIIDTSDGHLVSQVKASPK
jgi:hypothetical protein